MDRSRSPHQQRRLFNLLSSINSSIRKLLRKHKKRALAAFFLGLETISFVLDAVGKRKWSFLLAAFLVSLLGFATTVFSHTKRKPTVPPRGHAEKTLIAVEVGFSLIQVIGTFIYFVRAVSHVKIGFLESVFPLFFATIVFLFALFLRNDEDVSQQENLIPSLGDSRIAEIFFLVNPMSNNLIGSATMNTINEPLRRLRMRANQFSPTVPITYQVHYDDRLCRIEVIDPSLHEHHVSSLEDSHAVENVTGTMENTIHNTVNDASLHENYISPIENSPVVEDMAGTITNATQNEINPLAMASTTHMTQTDDQFWCVEVNDSSLQENHNSLSEDATIEDVTGTLTDAINP